MEDAGGVRCCMRLTRRETGASSPVLAGSPVFFDAVRQTALCARRFRSASCKEVESAGPSEAGEAGIAGVLAVANRTSHLTTQVLEAR